MLPLLVHTVQALQLLLLRLQGLLRVHVLLGHAIHGLTPHLLALLLLLLLLLCLHEGVQQMSLSAHDTSSGRAEGASAPKGAPTSSACGLA